MMFPVQGGMFHAVNKKIRKHNITPVISPDRICIRACGDVDYDDFEVTTPEPPMLGYNVEIKIVNLGENYQTPKPGTEEYRTFSNIIENNLRSIFKRVPGYKKMVVENVIR